MEFTLKRVSIRPKEARKVLERLLLSLSERFVPELLLNLCIEISSKIDKPPKTGSSHLLELFRTMKLQGKSILMISSILGNLRLFNLDMDSAIQYATDLEHKSNTRRMIRIEVLLNLKSKEFRLADVQFLWNSIGTNHNSIALRLLLSLKSLVPNLWS